MSVTSLTLQAYSLPENSISPFDSGEKSMAQKGFILSKAKRVAAVGPCYYYCLKPDTPLVRTGGSSRSHITTLKAAGYSQQPMAAK